MNHCGLLWRVDEARTRTKVDNKLHVKGRTKKAWEFELPLKMATCMNGSFMPMLIG